MRGEYEGPDLEEMENELSEIKTELSEIPELGELSEEEAFIRHAVVPRVVKVAHILYGAGCTPLLNKGHVFKNIEFKGIREGTLILEVTRKDGSKMTLSCKDALLSTGKAGRPVIVPIICGPLAVIRRR